ncbi:MAG: hypothetical protein K2Q15_03740 [Burkholderiales bacterium]|nr:hypothetical protein [Burkholderiales bacterium]
MKIFPIGTSRLHEPLSLFVNENSVSFPGMGYFHSSSQVVDIIKILTGDVNIDNEAAKFFFRKDQTPENKFDLSLWNNNYLSSIARISDLLKHSNILIIEVCTPRSYKFNNIHLQGNPNFYQNISYADIWKQSYYEKFNPELDVAIYDDFNKVDENIKYINEYLIKQNKYAIILGHLLNPTNPNIGRRNNNQSLINAINNIRSTRIKYYDPQELVSEFGFRILADGSLDIHHLPWDGLLKEATEMQYLINTFSA